MFMEAPHLELYDVTLTSCHYQIGTQSTFSRTSNAGPHDNITARKLIIGTTPGGNNLVSSASITGTN
jgi:hypothetical protein